MDSVIEAIKERRSIRAYKDKALPESVVQAVLEAGRYAPTARNLMELEYKVITSKELITRLSEEIEGVIKKNALDFRKRPNYFYQAPLLIIIAGPKDNEWLDVDAGLAVQNIMLYAQSVGLGTCFIGMARLIERDKKLAKELHIPANSRISSAVVCGYPDENPAEKEKKMNAEYFR
jgi:nitroreductase